MCLNIMSKKGGVPVGVSFSDGKSTKNKTTAKKPKDIEFGLFGGKS